MKPTRKKRQAISAERTKKCRMKIYADKGKHEALLQKDRDRKKVACKMKKFTQNDVEMAMRREKEKSRSLCKDRRPKSEKKKREKRCKSCIGVYSCKKK